MAEKVSIATTGRRSACSSITYIRNLLVVFAACLLWQGDAYATHAMGGDLTYECLGNNQYKITLNFFRDCNGVAAPTNCNNGRRFNIKSATCGADFSACFDLESVELITPICDAAADVCNDPSGLYGVERYRFSTVIDLGPWANCGTDWVVEWELCCRNNAITSLNNPGARNLYLSATLNNTVQPCNNSPRFLNDPVLFGCVGQPVVYNHGVSDIEGDSLTFELAPALGNNGAPIPYSAGYSFLQPLITNGGANAVQIDPQTGTITFVPSIQQFAVVTVLVSEYRNGVLLGTYLRDVQFAIIACSNNNPTASGIDGTNNFVYNVCAGESFCFTVNSADADAGQVVTMTWNNAIPEATFTTTGGSQPIGTFCWTPTAANIGTQLFSVIVQDDACELNGVGTQGYVINITPPFTPAQAGPDQSVCGTTANLIAQQPYPQLAGSWTVLSGTGTFANPNNPTTSVSGLSPGQNVFRWSIDHLTCGIASDEVVITSYSAAQPAANAGPNQQLCTPNDQTTLAANAAIAPAVGTWVVMSGAGVFANPNSPTTQVTGLVIGQNIFRWTINNGPCGAPTTSTVTVQLFDYALPAANAGPDQIFCSIPPIVQLGAQPNNGFWTVVNGSGVFADFTDRNTTVTGLSVGVNTFGWTIFNGPCDPPSTADQVSIIVYDPGSPAANAGPNQQVCSTTAVLAGNSPIAPATGTWSVVSGGATVTSPNSPTSGVTNLAIGQNIFQWTLNNGPCANGLTTSQVTITRFDPAVAAANAGPDQSLCTNVSSSFASTTLAANAPATPATGVWSVINGTANFASPTSATTAVTGLSVGVNTLRWTISNGPCTPPTTFDNVVITVYNRNAPAANAGPDQEVCAPVASVQLTGNPPVFPATGQWAVISGAGIFANAASPTTTVSGMAIGNNVYRWTTNNGPCPGAITTDDVVIRLFDGTNPAADAGPDQTLCGTGNTTMAGSALIAPATGAWSLISGVATIADPANPAASVSGIPIGVTVLRWTVNNGPCGTSFDDVTITRYSNSNPIANAGPDQSICLPVAPDQVTMAASSVIFPAVGTWSIVSGSGNIIDVNDPNTLVNNLPVGIHEFQWTVNNGPCSGGTTTDIVRIFVHNATSPPANAGPDQSLCSLSGSTTMAGSIPTLPAAGQWSLINGTGIIDDPADPATAVTGLQVGQNIFQWTVSNGPCGLTTDQMSIFVYDPNNPTANAGPDQGICTDSGNSIVLNGSAVIFPATGLWTVSGGVATIQDPNSPTTLVTDLTTGSYSFTWTVNNGACPDPISSSTTLVVVANGEAQPAFAGADQSVCGTSTSVVMNSNAPQFPATATWSVIQGSANFNDITSPTATVSGLSIGINILQWNIDNLECGITTDQLSIYVFDPAHPLANAGPDQSICTPVTSTSLNGSALTVPTTGQWTLISGSGTIANPASPTSTVSGLGVGENIFQWQVNNGVCTDPVSTDLVSIFLFDLDAPVANAGPDQEICTPQSSVSMAANSATASAVGVWTVINGGGTIVSPNDPNTTITGLPVGLNIFEWSLDNGACGISSDQVSIYVFDGTNPIANAGPDQDLCSTDPNTALNGSAVIFPATGMWTLISGTGTIADPTDPSSAVTDLAIGENIFEWIVENGPCANGVTIDQVSIFVFDEQNLAADAGADQEFCTPTSSSVLVGSALIFPATGVWQLESGSGDIADPNSSTTSVSGLAVGINIFSYTVDNGACESSSTFDQITIFIFDENNPVADAGPDQSLCSPVSSTSMAGSVPIIPATGTWALVSGSGAPVNASDPNTVINGLAVGENVFSWTVSNGPCEEGITTDLVSIFVYDVNNPMASAGSDQQLCTPVTIATLNASQVTFPAAGTWSVGSGSGTFTDPNSPSTTVTDLGVGVNVFIWTVDNGPCANGITTDEVSIILNDSNSPSPNAGPDQELCTPQLSTNLQGNAPVFPAFGTWSVLNGTGVFADENDPSTLVSQLSVGENVFAWTIFNGVCESGGGFDIVSIFVYDENVPNADSGPDQSLCTADITTTTTMSGSPVIFPATGTWTLASGSGIIVDPNDPNTTILDLPVGDHFFQWTVDNGPCANGVTSDVMMISVYDENTPVASAGPDQDLCTPIAAIQLQGSAIVPPAVGTWTITSGTGTLTNPNDPQTTIVGATPGVITLTWNVNNGPCPQGITSDEVIINLFDENNPVADAGSDQELCTPQSSTTLQGSPVTTPAQGEWVVLQGSATILDPNDPFTTVTDLGVGELVLSWNVSNGPCSESFTTDMMSIYVFDENNPDADAGPDQQVCTPLTNAFMSASQVTFPAVGTWTIISGQGTFTDANDPNTNITGLAIGDNVFEWTVDNGVCANGITTDQVTIVLFDADAPPADAGPDQELCAPGDEVTLAANPPVGSAVGTWSLSQGSGSFSNANDPNATVDGLVIGENIFTWTLESGDCVTTSDQVSIFVFDPENPIADAGFDQELCIPQDSVWMAASTSIFPAFGTWSVSSGTGTPVDPNDPNTMITGLSIGVNTFQWEVYNGPCANGLTIDLVDIIVFDDTTAAANAGPDLQTCIPILTMQLHAETPPAPAAGTWTLIAGTGDIADPNDPETMVSGLSQGINIFVWTLEWDPCPNNGILSDTMSVYVYDPLAPVADAGEDQQLCGPGVDAMLQGNTPAIPGVGTWSVTEGNAIVLSLNDPNSMVTGLDVGVHTLVWTIYNGLCGFGPPTTDTLRISVFDSEAPDALTGSDIFSCTPVDSAVLQANDPLFPATGEWTSLTSTGTFADPSDPFTAVFDLGVGQHDFSWTISNGPCGDSSDEMSVFIYGGDDDEADAGPDQQLCTPNTTTNLEGNPIAFPGTGTWTLVSGTGVIEDPSLYNTAVSGLSIGANVFQWSIQNGPCGDSTDEVLIMVYDEAHPLANAGPDQSLCSPTGVVQLQGSPVAFPATGQWVVVSGSATIEPPDSPNAIASGIGVGVTVLQWTVDNGPCQKGLTTDEMTITVFDGTVQAAAAGPDQSFCTPIAEAVTMLASPASASSTGMWSIVSGSATLASNTDPFTQVSDLQPGQTTFMWTIDNGACGTTSDEITISVFDHMVPPADAGPSLEQCEDETTAQMSAVPASSTAFGMWSLMEGNGNIVDQYDPNTEITSLLLGDNWFLWTVDNGSCGTSSDTLLIKLKDCLTIRIPDAFSPNADGVNDLFEIGNIISYPENRLQIFNRWGNKIYDRSPYDGSWDGTSQFGAVFGERLPESTYYYVLDLGNDSDAHTGFIFLRR